MFSASVVSPARHLKESLQQKNPPLQLKFGHPMVVSKSNHVLRSSEDQVHYIDYVACCSYPAISQGYTPYQLYQKGDVL